MPKDRGFVKIASLKSTDDFRARVAELGIELPVDETILTAEGGSPLAAPISVLGRQVGNRWCIHPMEGWDGTPAGAPTELTLRRWQRFGESGAKLIWGGEAVAVRHDGRANPNQLCATPANKGGLAQLRAVLVAAHQKAYGRTDDLLIGLQLTHSGRFCRPNEKIRPEPRILYHHPILDGRVGIQPDDNTPILTDDEIDTLIDDFVAAARMAAETGYDFVDVKACHGYLGHEFLGAHTREGKYGGSLENRTRFLRTTVARIRNEVPGLGIGVRISMFDILPYEDDPATRTSKQKGFGRPSAFEGPGPYRYGFGVNPDNPDEPDLAEPIALLERLVADDIRFINVTCGSPYYNPHIQRPAAFPPSDGYRPPEDPLVGVARQIQATRQLKARLGDAVTLVGTGYTYLQEYLPQVAQAVVRQGWADFVGIGRMVLAYPEMPADSLRTGVLDTKRICRTFSDCTTGPRKGLV
ncbi:MAG: NADH:flavin oxidoreductase, partial [Phycisphaerae bacterium]|nr:NADH:flavin oxidoreductase [Phycisphaerae bacterium]